MTNKFKREYRDVPEDVRKRISQTMRHKCKSFTHKQRISQSMKNYWKNVKWKNNGENTEERDEGKEF